jgi:hypothetical protein
MEGCETGYMKLHMDFFPGPLLGGATHRMYIVSMFDYDAVDGHIFQLLRTQHTEVNS